MTFLRTSLQSIGERLEALARQCGLKFNPGPAGTDVFISSDMFYVEVLMDNNGNVRDVKVAHHSGEPQSCLELKAVLKRNDFKEFAEHLRELNQLYQLAGDNSQKARAFMSLQALEADLVTMFQMQSGSLANIAIMVILKGPIGYLTPRSGGKPAQLTYYVSPYDLLNVETGTTTTLSMKDPVPRSLGFSVCVTIESSTLHKLQITPIISIPMSPDGKRTIGSPSFIPLGNPNSMTLPASFVVKLNKPMPLSTSSIRQIQVHTGMPFVDINHAVPLNGLICKHYSTNQSSTCPDKTSSYTTFFVTLPDQHHCYFINECSCAHDLKGIIVSKIAFTHPAHVPQILMYLRQQAVYNTLISSCVRNNSKQGMDDSILFDVTPVTPQRISVSFEHPVNEGMACAEFDLSELVNVKCRLHTRPGEQPLCSDEYATKVLQRCMSIPVTMRAILKKAATQQQHQYDGLQRIGATGFSSFSFPGSTDYTAFMPNTGRIGGNITLNLTKTDNSGNNQLKTVQTSTSTGMPIDKVISVQRYKTVLNDLPRGAITTSPFVRSISTTVTMDSESSCGPFGGMSTDDSKISQNPMLATLLQTTGNLNMMSQGGECVIVGGGSSNPALTTTTSSASTPVTTTAIAPTAVATTIGNSEETVNQIGKARNPMLMNLLQDQGTPLPSNVTQPQQIKPTRKRKRKLTTDRSPKRQQSEEEFTKELSAMDLDSTVPFDMSMHADTATITPTTLSEHGKIPPMAHTAMMCKSDYSKSRESAEVSAILTDIEEQSAKFNKRLFKRSDSCSSRAGQSPKTHPSDTPKHTGVHTPENVLNTVGDIPLTPTATDAGVHDALPPADSPMEHDIFMKPTDSEIFTPGDFMVDDTNTHPSADDLDHDFSEQIEFNVDVLNNQDNDGEFLKSTTEGNIDLDTCDATAFGLPNPAIIAKMTPTTSDTTVPSTSNSSATVAATTLEDTEIQTSEKQTLKNMSAELNMLLTSRDEVLDLSMPQKIKPIGKSATDENDDSPEFKVKRSISEVDSPKVIISKKGKKKDSKRSSDGESSHKRKQDSKRGKRRKGDGSKSKKSSSMSKMSTPTVTLTAKQIAPLKTTIRTITITPDGTQLKGGSKMSFKSVTMPLTKPCSGGKPSTMQMKAVTSAQERALETMSSLKVADSIAKNLPLTKTTDLLVKNTQSAKTTDSIVKNTHVAKNADSSLKNTQSTKTTDSIVKNIQSTKTSDSNLKSTQSTKAGDVIAKNVPTTKSTDITVKSTHVTKPTDASTKNVHSSKSSDSSVKSVHSTKSSDSSVKSVHSTKSSDSSVKSVHSTKSSDSSVKSVHSTKSFDSSVKSVHSTKSSDSSVKNVHSTKSSADTKNSQSTMKESKSTHPTKSSETSTKTTQPKQVTIKPVRPPPLVLPTDEPDTATTSSSSATILSPSKTMTSPLLSSKSKSPNRSRKGSLSAVIDKLKESASSVNVMSSVNPTKWMEPNEEGEKVEKRHPGKGSVVKQTTQKIVTAQSIGGTPIKPILVVRTVAVSTITPTPATTVLAVTTMAMSNKKKDDEKQLVSERESPESPDDSKSQITEKSLASPDRITDEHVRVIPLEQQNEGKTNEEVRKDVNESTDASSDFKSEKLIARRDEMKKEFKVPTPVSVSNPDGEKRSQSPSNESDEEDGLVIDVPHISNTKADSKTSDTQTETEIKSPRSVMAQSPLGFMAKSPLMVKSPAVKSPGNLSITGTSDQSHRSTDSPCLIDDELMDEAILYKD
ncbi:uncharacterized protein LOC100374848 [Saccoglossus kowalevskii]